MHKTNLQIIEDLIFFLKEANEKGESYRRSPPDFTRTRKLPLENIAGILINMPRKSLSLELGEFFVQMPQNLTVTKSAFSQARYKLKHEFFEDWNSELTLSFYTEDEERVKKWNNFILFGVDGSTLHLFEDAEGNIAEHFGKYKGAVTGRVMCMYDVLNQISYKNQLAPIQISENEIARNWVHNLGSDKTFLGEVLCLYDMKFPGFAMAYEHINQGVNFVMRAERTFNTMVYDFANSRKKQLVTKWYPSDGGLKELQQKGYAIGEEDFIKVRLIKIELPNGEVEYLITSLLDIRKYPRKDFGPLYFKRWGSETNFDVWKNKTQIENFSGHSVEAIYQDFHATVFTANVHSLFVQDCEEDLKQINQERKLDYAINKNVSLGLLKGKIVQLFLGLNPEQIARKLHELFITKLEPVRPDREFSRKKRIQHLNGKYVTMTNYRRAI